MLLVRRRVAAKVKTQLQDELAVYESVARRVHHLLVDGEETNWWHVHSWRREYTFCWQTKKSLRLASNLVLTWYNVRN